MVGIVALPVGLWALMIAFVVVVFAHGESRDQGETVEVDAPVAEPARQPLRERSGLGWMPPVASHHH